MGKGDAGTISRGGIRVADPIVERLHHLEGYLRELEVVARRDPKPRTSDWYAAERLLQLCAECCIDVGEILISRRGLRKPATYREVFAVLTEAGILEEQLGRRFEDVAGMRNVLVHMYTEIDHGKVRAAFSGLDAFRRFAEAVVAATDREA